ncbi:MAG: PstS family phosphate ABC transporter substrate-binding protein [Elainellaceae cyanobacterium]
MAKKNDTPILIAAFLLTAALLSAGGWWLTRQFGNNLGNIVSNDNSSDSTTPSSPASSAVSGIPDYQTLASVPDVPSGLFSYGGSTTWAPVRGTIDPGIQQSHAGFQLRYTDPVSGAASSGAGIQMLLNNQISFSQSSRSLNPQEIQAAQQRNFTLREIPVALEGIAIAVHPELSVEGLTIEQLNGIYTGLLNNWNQVGGPNLAITPYSRSTDGGTVEFFISNVMGGATFGSTVQIVPTTTEALRAVSSNPGGIYFASAPEVIGQCTTKPLAIGNSSTSLIAPYQAPLVPSSQCPAQRNQINMAVLQNGEYPLTRRLLVIVKENGQADQQAGEAYATLLLSQEGQSLLEQVGFVSIR